MKTKMLIFVFLLGITDLFAQTLYVPGTIVKGKNASYYCSTEYEILIKVNNVNNVDTTTTMYYDDGTVVPYYVGLGGTIETKNEDLVRVFQGKHSNKCTFYTLRFGCSFAAVNTIKPQLL